MSIITWVKAGDEIEVFSRTDSTTTIVKIDDDPYVEKSLGNTLWVRFRKNQHAHFSESQQQWEYFGKVI